MKKGIFAMVLMVLAVVGCAEEAKADSYDDDYAYMGMQGEQGPAGPRGAEGPKGHMGDKGNVGATGSGFDSSALDFGLASAAALSNIPDDLGVGSTSVGVGAGFYSKTDAVALGLTHRFSEEIVVKASVAQSLTKQLDDNGKHSLWGVGAAYRF